MLWRILMVECRPSPQKFGGDFPRSHSKVRHDDGQCVWEIVLQTLLLGWRSHLARIFSLHAFFTFYHSLGSYIATFIRCFASNTACMLRGDSLSSWCDGSFTFFLTDAGLNVWSFSPVFLSIYDPQSCYSMLYNAVYTFYVVYYGDLLRKNRIYCQFSHFALLYVYILSCLLYPFKGFCRFDNAWPRDFVLQCKIIVTNSLPENLLFPSGIRRYLM